ncbi:MAG: phosphatase PAP2 family protein [Clostridia bacterium]|nr:phosphatase PAP2 family protein [Clostridia bacterium]
MNAFELQILDKIQDIFACSFLDFVMPKITFLGEAVSVIAFALVLVRIKKARRTGICAGLALLIGVIIVNLIIKNAVERPRPCDLNTAFNLLIKRSYDSSFPSGHSLACFELTSVLMIKNKKIGIPVLILSVIIAFSRMYLYLHFPSDVLIGAFLGIIFGFTACFIVDKVYKKYNLDK